MARSSFTAIISVLQSDARFAIVQEGELLARAAMFRLQISKRLAQLRDVLRAEHRAYIQMARHQSGSVQHAREPADDDEIDLSVAQALNQLVELHHAVVVRCVPVRMPARARLDAARPACHRSR